MKKIICTASLHAVGCTFVDWSIHFLSGQSIFYSVNTQTWRPLVANPVSKTNAHGHNKNHPSGLDSIKQCVTDFQNNNTGQLFSFYPYPMHADIACRQLGLEPPKQLDSVLTEKIQTKRKQDWIDAIDYCLEQNLKVIYIELDKQDLLYTISPRNIGRMFFDPSWADSAEQARAHVDNLFFANDYKAWQQQGLVNIWDRLTIAVAQWTTHNKKDHGILRVGR
jgi:hypothetical protein